MASTKKSTIFGASKTERFRGYDIVGNIAILKFARGVSGKEKKKMGEKFLGENKSVRTVLEKIGKFSGRLRTQGTKYIAGEKTKEALYRENECVFRFNVDTCYFSPRLSTERKEIAKMVKKGEKVLVLFGGVAPFAVTIGKLSRVEKVVSVELGKECNKYAIENVRRNKLLGKVEIVQGDVRKVFNKPFLSAVKSKEDNQRLSSVRKAKFGRGYDRVIMARPNLEDSFLDVGFKAVRKGGIIYYYGFYSEDEKGKLKDLIMEEGKKAKRKVKILRIKEAGEIGARKFRYRADVKMLDN